MCVCGMYLWYVCACACGMEEAEEAADWAGRALGLGNASRTAGRMDPVPAAVRKAQLLPAARPGAQAVRPGQVRGREGQH